MKNKRAAFGFITKIILGVFTVGIVAFIVFSLIHQSTNDIFEPLKKLVGIETSKAEASTKNTDECTIQRYYWSKNSVKVGENAEIIIEGKGNCNGKQVRLGIYSGVFYEISNDVLGPRRENKEIAEFQNTFNQNTIKTDITVRKDDTNARLLYYYFILKFGDYTSPESERLEIA